MAIPARTNIFAPALLAAALASGSAAGAEGAPRVTGAVQRDVSAALALPGAARGSAEIAPQAGTGTVRPADFPAAAAESAQDAPAKLNHDAKHPDWVEFPAVHWLVDTNIRKINKEWSEFRTQVAELMSILCKLWFPFMMVGYWRTYRKIRAEGMRVDLGTWLIFLGSNLTQFTFGCVSGIYTIIVTMTPAVVSCMAIYKADHKERALWKHLDGIADLVRKRLGRTPEDGEDAAPGPQVEHGVEAVRMRVKRDLLAARNEEDAPTLEDKNGFQRFVFELRAGVQENPGDRLILRESLRLYGELKNGGEGKWEKIEKLTTAAEECELLTPSRTGVTTIFRRTSGEASDSLPAQN